ncbi:42723_t:CDS:2 [Gigaspora margarita]|uniref:42723_t:CDS:1 n=1 Tax=Gigaspora margarita TaxID=4874 RepID=A0ABN7UMM7_GIGMA|nr:42723_t:CDS:2 [Gigaspora margarita]
MANDICSGKATRNKVQDAGKCLVISDDNLTSFGFSSDQFQIYRNNQDLMDPLVCVDHCSDFIFEYAALKGDKCRCGNSSFNTKYAQLFNNESSCNTSCNNHYSWNNNTEKYDKLSLIKNVMPGVSCVEDNSKRVMKSCLGEVGNNTIESCIEKCRSQNSTCAGLEDGAQCFCSDNSTCDKLPSIDSIQCSSSCKGNNLQICGGPWALSLYEINPTNPPENEKFMIRYPWSIIAIIMRALQLLNKLPVRPNLQILENRLDTVDQAFLDYLSDHPHLTKVGLDNYLKIHNTQIQVLDDMEQQLLNSTRWFFCF